MQPIEEREPRVAHGEIACVGRRFRIRSTNSGRAESVEHQTITFLRSAHGVVSFDAWRARLVVPVGGFQCGLQQESDAFVAREANCCERAFCS
jgi:hypothetical protein